jgi:transcriptional regulator with XRE-family HTH domain
MTELNTAAIGLAVRSARERLKITGNDLASQTKMNPSSLSRSEQGKRMLSLDEAASVARVLGMSIQDLVDLAAELEKQGLVKQRDVAAQDFQKALERARDAASSAMNQLQADE